MNIAERIVAGPPVLATVGRRAAKGDVVYLSPEDEQDFVAEVVEVYPSIVNAGPNVLLRGLYDGKESYAYPRDVVVLTKVEAKAVRDHIHLNWRA